MKIKSYFEVYTKQSKHDPKNRARWDGLDYVERQASMWHNKLVHIILYGIDARGSEHLTEAETKLRELLAQRVPGNQKHHVARWWDHKRTDLQRLWKEAREVAEGVRKPKLAGR